MKRIIYIPFDHLRRKFGALKGATPGEDVIALIESARARGIEGFRARNYLELSYFLQTLMREENH